MFDLTEIFCEANFCLLEQLFFVIGTLYTCEDNSRSYIAASITKSDNSVEKTSMFDKDQTGLQCQ